MRFVIDEHQSSVMALIFISVITDVKVWDQTLQWWIWKLIYVYGEPFDFAWFIFVSRSIVKQVDIPLSQAWFISVLFKYKKKNILKLKIGVNIYIMPSTSAGARSPSGLLVIRRVAFLSFWDGFVRHGFSRHFLTDSVSRNTDTCSPDFPHACFRHVQTSLAWV